MIRTHQWKALTMVATLALFGCSSDGDDGEETGASITGIASKGIIKNGEVNAYAVANGIVSSTPIETTTTDENGRYSLTISDYSGPLSIVVTPAGSGGSTVKCDVRPNCTQGGIDYDFGDDMPLDFPMEAVVPNVATGDTVSASITPLTHMAASFAKSRGLTQDTIQQANDKVESLLGITDILGTEPVDVTDEDSVESTASTVTAIKYGYLAAAIAKVSRDTSQDLGTTLNALASNYTANNGELIQNEGNSNDPGIISLAEITQASLDTINANQSAGVQTHADVSSDLGDLGQSADSADAGKPTDTDVAPISNDDITEAKAIVDELRSWAPTISSQLETGGQAFSDQIDVATTASELAFENVGEAASFGIVAMASVYEARLQGIISDGSHAIADYVDDSMLQDYFLEHGMAPTLDGNVVVSGNRVSITDGIIVGATVNLVATGPSSSTGTRFTVSFDTESANKVENDAASFSITQGTATIGFDESIDLLAETEQADATSLSLDLEIVLTQKGVADPVSFTGLMQGDTEVYEYTDPNNPPDTDGDINPGQFKLSGVFANNDNRFEATFEAFMRNADTFRPEFLSLGTVKADIATYSFSNNNNTLTIAFPDKTITYEFVPESSVIVFTEVETGDDGDTYSGSFFVAESTFIEFLQNWQTAWFADVDSEGEYRVDPPAIWAPTGGTLDGVLIWVNEDGENKNNWRDIDGTLTFDASFDAHPDATVTLAVNRSGFRTATASMTFEFNNYTITVSGSADLDNEEGDFSIVATNQQTGSRLTIYPDLQADKARGSVVVNGNVVGVIRESATLADVLLIDYQDGTFETVTF